MLRAFAAGMGAATAAFVGFAIGTAGLAYFAHTYADRMILRFAGITASALKRSTRRPASTA